METGVNITEKIDDAGWVTKRFLEMHSFVLPNNAKNIILEHISALPVEVWNLMSSQLPETADNAQSEAVYFEKSVLYCSNYQNEKTCH